MMLCPEGKRIVLIEYRLERVDGVLQPVPFAVLSERLCYDFDWCRRDQMVYFENTGSGGKVRGTHAFGGFIKKRPRLPVWFDRNFVTPGYYHRRQNGRWGVRRLRSNWRKWLNRKGYHVLRQPAVLGGATCNPFEWQLADADICEYCRICDDHFPVGWYSEPCEHLWFCDDCGVWSGPGSYDGCRCSRLEAA